MGGCGNELQKDFSVSRCNHMNYCTRAYSKQSILLSLRKITAAAAAKQFTKERI